jgi:hypothetical protein
MDAEAAGVKRLTLREVLFILAAFAAGAATPPVLATARNPFPIVNGDGWLTSNADYLDGTWSAPNPARPAFGLQMSARNDLPFDRGTAGATFWVHNGGCPSAFATFSVPCGWQLGLAVTQFRSLVVGGQGIEVDGLGAPPPYARFVDTTDGTTRLAGVLSNAFVDLSGVDAPSAPSWFNGLDLGRDTFTVRRAAAGTRVFSDLFTVDAHGDASAAGSLSAARAEQSAPSQWAARVRLARGRAVFRFAIPFANIPVCVATPERGAPVRVQPSTKACVITSLDTTDDAPVDVVVIGNPS